MKHKFFFITGIICLSLSFFCGCNQKVATVSPAEPLVASFLATGAVGEEVRLVAWSKISPQSLDKKELTDYVEKTAKALAPNLTKISATNLGSWQEIVYSGSWDNCNYRIIGQSSLDGSHIFVSLQTYGPCTLLPELRKRCFSVLPQEVEINTLLIGTIYEDLNQKQLEDRFGLALEAAGAQKIEQAAEANFYSLSAFTPGLLPEVESGGKKINLQLGAGLGKKEVIKVYVGSPLIFIDY